jgi:hypothetical protein
MVEQIGVVKSCAPAFAAEGKQAGQAYARGFGGQRVSGPTVGGSAGASASGEAAGQRVRGRIRPGHAQGQPGSRGLALQGRRPHPGEVLRAQVPRPVPGTAGRGRGGRRRDGGHRRGRGCAVHRVGRLRRAGSRSGQPVVDGHAQHRHARHHEPRYGVRGSAGQRLGDGEHGVHSFGRADPARHGERQRRRRDSHRGRARPRGERAPRSGGRVRTAHAGADRRPDTVRAGGRRVRRDGRERLGGVRGREQRPGDPGRHAAHDRGARGYAGRQSREREYRPAEQLPLHPGPDHRRRARPHAPGLRRARVLPGLLDRRERGAHRRPRPARRDQRAAAAGDAAGRLVLSHVDDPVQGRRGHRQALGRPRQQDQQCWEGAPGHREVRGQGRNGDRRSRRGRAQPRHARGHGPLDRADATR